MSVPLCTWGIVLLYTCTLSSMVSRYDTTGGSLMLCRVSGLLYLSSLFSLYVCVLSVTQYGPLFFPASLCRVCTYVLRERIPASASVHVIYVQL